VTRERKDARWKHFPALVPLNADYTVSGRPILMVGDADAGEQALFYNALLEIPWLAPKVRRAIMAELGLSLREQNTKIERARTLTLRHMISEAEVRMRKNRERPRGGIHGAAVEEVAGRVGMTVDALEKRFQRLS
jgi:hypothetical protein